jgi:pimeloyl-ACP methyl ester carboxylesterase
MKKLLNPDYSFENGTYAFHKNPTFNFQLNRTVQWGGGSITEIREAGKSITDATSWEKTLLSLGEKALEEKRIENAIAYFRMAEFFMFDSNPDKIKTYDRAREMFYDLHSQEFKDGKIIRGEVPYESGFLPVWHAEPAEGPIREVLLISGGFDSYLEEFLNVILYLRSQGFSVYLFEGPGQGAAIRKFRLSLTHKWEKPVKAILDYYNLNEVTAIGLSLGGMLTPRAAAFEPRIKRVVAWSIFPNFLEVMISTREPKIQNIIKSLLKFRLKSFFNFVVHKQMKKDPLAKWGVEHGIFVLGTQSPYDYFKMANEFQLDNIAGQITQDFLLLGAQKDHLIPVEYYKKVIDRLTNVRSLTYRLFTSYEKAENHCNIGNSVLALDFIVNWIEGLKKRDNTSREDHSNDQKRGDETLGKICINTDELVQKNY